MAQGEPQLFIVWNAFKSHFVPDAGEAPLFVCRTKKIRALSGFFSVFQDAEVSRELLLTTNALYNFEPGEYGRPNRAMRVCNITGLVISTSSLEMLIQLGGKKPKEVYDFHIEAVSADSRQRLVTELQQAFAHAKLTEGVAECDRILSVVPAEQSDLTSVMCTKEMSLVKMSIDTRLWLYRRCVVNVVPPEYEMPQFDDSLSDRCDFCNLATNSSILSHISSVEGPNSPLLLSIGAVAVGAASPKRTLVLSAHHLFIFYWTQKDYATPERAFALANIDGIVVSTSSSQVCLQLRNERDFLLQFDLSTTPEAQRQCFLCGVFGQFQESAGYRIVPQMTDRSDLSVGMCTEAFVPQKRVIECQSDDVLEKYEKLLAAREPPTLEAAPIEEPQEEAWEEVQLAPAPEPAPPPPLPVRIAPTLAELQARFSENAPAGRSLRASLRLRYDLDRRSRTDAFVNPLRERAADAPASVYGFDFLYLQNNGRVRRALRALESGARNRILFSDVVEWFNDDELPAESRRMMLVATEVALYVFEVLDTSDNVPSPVLTLAHDTIDGCVRSVHALPLREFHEQQAQALKAARAHDHTHSSLASPSNRAKPSTPGASGTQTPIKILSPSAAATVQVASPIQSPSDLDASGSHIAADAYTRAFDTTTSQQIVVQCAQFGAGDLRVALGKFYNAECLALVVREQFQRARFVIDGAERLLFSHVAATDALQEFCCPAHEVGSALKNAAQRISHAAFDADFAAMHARQARLADARDKLAAAEAKKKRLLAEQRAAAEREAAAAVLAFVNARSVTEVRFRGESEMDANRSPSAADTFLDPRAAARAAPLPPSHLFPTIQGIEGEASYSRIGVNK